MHPAVRVTGLSKLYRIGEGPTGSYRTLRESIARTALAPWRRLRRWLRRPEARRERRGPSTVWALQDVSFEVNPGEVVGVIGHNGAGKSTLLKVLSRVVEPSAGRVELRGRVGSLLEVGTGFHHELTGRENVFLNGTILGMSRQEIARKFDEIVAFAEVGPFLDTPVKRYSSGMYLRLAFAVAAHLETELLLVDEVLAVGDANFQKKCLGKMDEFGRSGRTVLFVSHDLAAVRRLCHRCLLFAGGRLRQDGPTEPVLAHYLGQGQPSATGHFDLTGHPSRPARCQPIIRELRLFTKDGEAAGSFAAGEPIVAEVVLEPPTPIEQPRLALSVEDGWGRRLTTVANYFGDGPVRALAGTSRVRCTVPRPGLAPGRYLLSVSLAEKSSGLLDEVSSAGCVEVYWNDQFRNGEPYLSVYGPVLTESAWEHVP